MSESTPATPSRRRRWILGGAILGALSVLGGAAALVGAHAGFLHGRGGPMNPEALAHRIEHGVKFALSDVDATPEQKAKVTAILQAAAKDVHTMAGQHSSAHKQFHEILSGPSIDRARLETLREDHLRLADEASQRIVKALADAADVLTPQQRAQLAATLEEHRRWRHGEE